MAINQGKRSIRLDLKNSEDLVLARGLVESADVVLENFRPGAMERLGLGFEDVRELNPSVVYCSVTGFGSRGPLAGEPCTDPHMQAFSGFAAGNADPPDGLPRRVRYYALVDLVTSCVAAEATCAGLMLRDGTGEAVRVETSMLEAMCDVLAGDAKASCFPDGIFRTADGYLALTCADDPEAWRRLVDVLASAALADESPARRDIRVATRERVESETARALLRLPSAAWAHSLARGGIACARVTRAEAVIARKDLWDAGVLRALPTPSGQLVAGGPPWWPGGNVGAPAAPSPGEHTDGFRSDPEGVWSQPPSPRPT
jgi:crotonobetainyl-CoA:carnitine CoA-transferase CaiB-like acyl-CoA transferase